MLAAVLTVMIPATLTGFGFLVSWGVGIDKKVATNEKLVDQKYADLKELIEAKFDNVSNSFSSQNQRLDRIERSLNGALRH
jgi:hypothetical protein